MTVLSQSIIKSFCVLCDNVHGAWVTRRTIFDDNRDTRALEQDRGINYFFSWLSQITQEYVLLQIVKLHDPAVQKNDINLTLDYMINYGGWDEETHDRLIKIYNKLNELAQEIKSARNKILSHNDLKAIVDGLPLGSFAEGKDIEYFDMLQEFVNIIHSKSLGSLCPFDSLPRNDAEIFLNIIQGTISHEG